MRQTKKTVSVATAIEMPKGNSTTTTDALLKDAKFLLSKKLDELEQLNDKFIRAQQELDTLKLGLNKKSEELETKMNEIAEIAVSERANGGIFYKDSKVLFDCGTTIGFRKLPPSVILAAQNEDVNSVIARIQSLLPEQVANELLRRKEVVSLDKGAVKKMLESGTNIPKNWAKIGLRLLVGAEEVIVDLKSLQGNWQSTFSSKID